MRNQHAYRYLSFITKHYKFPLVQTNLLISFFQNHTIHHFSSRRQMRQFKLQMMLNKSHISAAQGVIAFISFVFNMTVNQGIFNRNGYHSPFFSAVGTNELISYPFIINLHFTANRISRPRNTLVIGNKKSHQ